jgi:hypothetical protein
VYAAGGVDIIERLASRGLYTVLTDIAMIAAKSETASTPMTEPAAVA